MTVKSQSDVNSLSWKIILVLLSVLLSICITLATWALGGVSDLNERMAKVETQSITKDDAQDLWNAISEIRQATIVMTETNAKDHERIFEEYVKTNSILDKISEKLENK